MTPTTRWKHALPVLLFAVLASCNSDNAPPTGVPGIQAGSAKLAPFLTSGSAIPDRYIVVLKDEVGDVSAMSQSIVSTHGGKVHYNYRSALKGFAATLSPAAVEALRRNPLVTLVAADGMGYASIDQVNPPSWGLDRIDQRPLPLNSHYTYAKTGAGVNVYIIDTGIRTAHTEFGGRAVVGADFVGAGSQVCNGHGTLVAGTVAGNTFGVAKAARVIAVRVVPCSGGTPNSTQIAGIDWVTADVMKLPSDLTKIGGLPAVANISIAGGFSAPLNAAVQNMINARVVTVVGAGNEDQNACLVSPASTPAAITVGASTIADERWPLSNWGSCVDIFAPGLDITSASSTSNTAVATASGTSMAAPHVAGVAALYLEGSVAPFPTPATVANAILTASTMNRLTDLGEGSPNTLLFSPLTASTTAFSLNPSAVSFTFLRTSPAAAAVDTREGPAKAPIFKMSGGGLAKMGKSGDEGTVHVTTTSPVGSATISLKNVRTGLREWEAEASSSIPLSMSPSNGVITGGGSSLITATVNSGGLGIGTHTTGSIRVTDLSVSPVAATVLPITVSVAVSTPLLNGVPKTNLAGLVGSLAFYTISVPAGTPSLKVAISGGFGDAGLYVRYNLAPDFTNFDCRPFFAGNDEVCVATNPAAGNYYVMLYAIAPYGGVTLSATMEDVAPTAPNFVATTAVSPTEANVTWSDASTNETSFRVSRRIGKPDGSFGSWALIATVAANVTSFLNGGLTPATSYQYRVRACNAVSCSIARDGPVVSTAALAGSPIPPASLFGSIASATQINLSWTNSSTDETSFQLQRRIRNIDGVTWGNWTALISLGADVTTYSNTGLTPATTYQYMVRACNVIGCSVFRLGGFVTTPVVAGSPTAPTGLVAAVTSPTDIRLGWGDASPNETDFTLHRRLQNLDGVSWGAWAQISTRPANTNVFDDTLLTPGATYQYAIRACNAAGCSIYRLSAGVTTPEG